MSEIKMIDPSLLLQQRVSCRTKAKSSEAFIQSTGGPGFPKAIEWPAGSPADNALHGRQWIIYNACKTV